MRKKFYGLCRQGQKAWGLRIEKFRFLVPGRLRFETLPV